MKKVEKPSYDFPAALNIEAREKQLASLAFDEAERLIREGKATSQLLVHFLKVGSVDNTMSQSLMSENIKLAKAKTTSLENASSEDILYNEVIASLSSYRGDENEDI